MSPDLPASPVATDISRTLADDWADGWPAIGIPEVQKLPRCQRGGRGPNKFTILRWFHKPMRAPGGVPVLLESEKAGGRRVTSEPAVDRFFARLSGPAPVAPLPRSPAAARRGLAQAERLLQEAGI